MSKLTDSDTENAKIFPHLLLTHKDGTKEYLWFDYLIADGDTFKSNKFVAYDFVEIDILPRLKHAGFLGANVVCC